jgi:hypothetical protein
MGQMGSVIFYDPLHLDQSDYDDRVQKDVGGEVGSLYATD